MAILADLAHIRVGYTYRGSLRFAHSGDIAVVQMKDVTQQGLGDVADMARISLNQLQPHYLLQNGDLVFRARGLSNQAWAVLSPAPRMICIAPLLFIRIHDQQQLLPGFLEWFINLTETQEHISRLARGCQIRMIGVRALEKLELLLPPPACQQQVVQLYAMHKKSQQLEAQLLQKRLQYTESALLQFARGQLPFEAVLKHSVR